MVSLNTNSLQSRAKRRAIFKHCREAKFEFCLLLETHSIRDLEKIWRAEWGGQISFAHGESNARGVAILVRRWSGFTLDDIEIDPSGRYILARISREQETFLLGNVYMPTQDHAENQIAIIEELEKKNISSTGPHHRHLRG